MGMHNKHSVGMCGIHVYLLTSYNANKETPTTLSFVDVRFIAYNKNPDNNTPAPPPFPAPPAHQAGDLKRQLRKALEKEARFDERVIWKYFSQIAGGEL